MKRADLEYHLPPELIAQSPTEPRDHCRMLVVRRDDHSIHDRHFYDLGDYLQRGDVLVLNDTKVIPARLTLMRRTGGRLEGLFVRELDRSRWELMIRGIGKLKIGETLAIEGSDRCVRLAERSSEKTAIVELDQPTGAIEFLDRIGRMPLPAYIHRDGAGEDLEEEDRRWYQTVYSRAPGAIAAPTAGLHFTEAQLTALRQSGIETAMVTLHVGRGTFEPITAGSLGEHKMDREWYDVSVEAAATINAGRERGSKIVAVGTTAVRVLESAGVGGRLEPGRGWTDLFIYPPYRFRRVDALITNFHLPETTLLALVYAFAGAELVRRAYQHAIEKRYRFYSDGDAMVIL